MSRSSLSLLSFNFTIAAADSALWAAAPAVAAAAPPAPPPAPAAAFALLDAEEESDK